MSKKRTKSVPDGLAGYCVFCEYMLSSHAATKMKKALDVKEVVEISCCTEVTEEGKAKTVD